MKGCINKGCREAVSQPQVSGRGREAAAVVLVLPAGGGVEPFGHFWLRSLGRCAAPDPTSHVIRGGVNQQLAAQMKKCQLLPGAQQADRPRRGCIPARPGFVILQPPTHTHTRVHMGHHSQLN